MENQLNSWAIQNFDALLHAVRQMYLWAPDSVVKLIERWLVNVDEFKSQLAGQFASLHLFSMHENPSQLIMHRHKPLLHLLDHIFSPPEILENELNRTVALALQNWLAIETDDPTIRDEISLKLIEIADRAETQEMENLSVLLDFWIESSVSTVNELARLLNNRIHVMSGFPVEKAGGRYGIIIFDSSYIAGLDKKAARCVRDILDSLEPQIDLYTMRMGEKQIVASPNEVISTSRLHTKRVLPRLIYPTLETFPRDLTQADFILLLTWGEILDIDDVPDEWAEKAILAFSDTAKEAKKIWSRDENVVVFDGNKSTRPVKDHIQIHIAQTLANIKNTIETEIELLASLFEQLRLRNLRSSQEDPARRIMYLIQIQASNDLVFTVNQLISWFETDRNDIRHYIARASARMLFRLFGSVVPVPSVKTHDILLSLVPILANENSPWASGKIILTALRNWALGDSQWMVRVFSHPHGRSVELFSLVDKLTKTHGKQVKTLLKTWEEVDSPPESLFKFTERIRLRLEIGQKRSLPELSDSRQFVVIIYDASTQHQVYKQRLARIVSKLLTELNHKHEARMFTLTYRFGFDQIIAEGNQKIEPDQLMSDNMRYSPILGPILEIHKPESVACVLVLTAGRIIDHRDWQNSVWTDRLLVYDDSSTNPRWAEPYSIIAAEKNESDAINQIMNRIEERVGV